MDKKSATLGLAGTRETQIALGLDHMNLCKFGSPENSNYNQVASNIVELAEDAVAKAII